MRIKTGGEVSGDAHSHEGGELREGYARRIPDACARERYGIGKCSLGHRANSLAEIRMTMLGRLVYAHKPADG